MWNQSYLELLTKILEWDFKVLCPWKDGFEGLRLSKQFRAFYASPFILALIMTSFVFYEWNFLSLITVAENIATAIGFARTFGYAFLVKKFFGDYKRQIDKLLEDRKSLPLDAKEKAITESYCKTEFRLTLAHHINLFCIVFLLIHVLVYLVPNDYDLPFNCYIVFLPVDGFLFAWELNYLAQTVATALCGLTMASYVPLPFLMMDHSCWLLDMALVTASDINETLLPDEDIRDPERVAKIIETLKKFTERCEKFVEWQKEAQDLLFWSFNLEFQVQSLILCLSIYVLSFTFTDGLIIIMFSFCAIQTFVLCWMGTRVTSRIEQLSFQISKNWYLMVPKQRKELQMILHWTQNMKGFTGMFKDVGLETCKEIFEASYTFYAFLRSTNAS